MAEGTKWSILDPALMADRSVHLVPPMFGLQPVVRAVGHIRLKAKFQLLKYVGFEALRYITHE